MAKATAGKKNNNFIALAEKIRLSDFIMLSKRVAALNEADPTTFFANCHANSDAFLPESFPKQKARGLPAGLGEGVFDLVMHGAAVGLGLRNLYLFSRLNFAHGFAHVVAGLARIAGG